MVMMDDALPGPAGFNLPYGVTQADIDGPEIPRQCEDCALVDLPDQCDRDGDCCGPWAELHEYLDDDPSKACDMCQMPTCDEDGEWPDCGGPYDENARMMDGAQPEGGDK